jgi:ribulose-5-phosphate 4-epimerase/fuculose-1-phosphate aldolase
LIDLEANTLKGQGQVERSAFHIHTRLHRRRPDFRCFLHAHMPYTTALSMLKNNRLRPYGQRSEAELHFSSLKRVLAQEFPAFRLDPALAYQI